MRRLLTWLQDALRRRLSWRYRALAAESALVRARTDLAGAQALAEIQKAEVARLRALLGVERAVKEELGERCDRAERELSALLALSPRGQA